MSNPLKCVHVGKWQFNYWHGWRFWKLLPERRRYWNDEITHWHWLCFDIGYDGRKDFLGDWMGKHRDKEGGAGS